MKKIITTILTVFFLFSATAQEKALAKIHYQFKHVNDTTKRDNFLLDEVVTSLGETGSYYMSNSANRISEQMTAQMSSSTFDGNIVITGTGTAIKDWYLLDHKQEAMRKVRKIGRGEFIVTESYPVQEWQIEDDTKIIGGYTCQKATTTFKGRNYEAWFCVDIPMSYGPWKLHGLPGLILAAKDTKDDVIFEYAGFDRLYDNTGILIAASAKAIASSDADFDKLEKAYKENPTAFMQAQQGSQGGNAKIISVNVSSGSSATQNTSATFSKAGGDAEGAPPTNIKSVSINKDQSYKPSLVMNNPIELTK